MKTNSLFESLLPKVEKNLVSRRYSLPEIISEGYKVLYQCEDDTNLKKLAESYIEDVKSDPSDVDTLSEGLSVLKSLLEMSKSGELKDEDLVLTEGAVEKPLPEGARKLRRREGCSAKTECDISKTTECDTPKKEEIDEAEEVDLTDEEVEELAKHLDQIRREGKLKHTNKAPVEESKESCPHCGKSPCVCEGKKEDLEEGSFNYTNPETKALKKAIQGLIVDNPEERKEIVLAILADVEDSISEGISLEDNGSLVDEKKHDTVEPKEPVNEGLNEEDDIVPPVENAPARVSVVLKDILDTWHLLDKYNVGYKEYREGEGVIIPAEEYKKLLDTVVNKDYVRGLVVQNMQESKKVDESKSWSDISLKDFNQKSSGKAFYKTFKKMKEALDEGRVLTRQESINLYKAANSAMTQLSVELEHNPEFLTTFNESTALLSKDVDSLLESMKKGKSPRKSTMKSLAKFTEALLLEYDEEDEDDFEIEDEVGTEVDGTIAEEGDFASEAEEEFDEEYADARVELHKELEAEHAGDEDPGVQEKLAQDAEEVVNLPGITDEQVAEIEGTSEEMPPEEEITPEEDSQEVTDDELAELKRHLKEMRANKKRES